MKVLQLCKFYPPVTGGMEAVVHALATGLARRGVDVSVLCANTGATTVRERSEGVAIVRAASLGRVLSTSISPSLVGACVQQAARADIVHIHMPDPLTALALRLSATGARVVVHWHSDVVRQRLSRRLYEPLQSWLLGRADAIIATSARYAASSPWLRDVAAKVSVVPIGIGDNAGRAPAAAVAAVRSRFGGRHIVFGLGRMVGYKGFDVLIDAAARLPAHAVVVVGGDGPLLERHRRSVTDRGLGEKIHFVGRISQSDLPVYFAASRVFCLPSTQRSEAYGVVLVEAMAAGLPVVATSIPGSGVGWVNADGVTGFNVPVGDAPALSEALERLIDDDALAARFGRAARERFLADLTEAEMVDRSLHLYQRLMSAGAAASSPAPKA